MKKVKIGIVDDHKIVRDGIRLMLLGNNNYHLVFEAETIMQMLEHVKKDCPDLLLLDLNLPGTGGLDVIESLRSKYDEMKVLVLSANFDEHSIMTAIEKGVHGYVSKDAGSEELLEAIDVLMSGEEYFGETVSRIVYKSFLKSTNAVNISSSSTEALFLTDREMDVLKCFAEGMSYKQVADQLNISPRTVETHRMNIMNKLGLENLAQLVKFAIKNGIISL